MIATATRNKIQLKNILFATDFSATANSAIPYAKALAKRFEANLFAFHVRPPVFRPVPPEITWAVPLEISGYEDKERTQQLLAAFPGVHTDVIFVDGLLGNELEAAIQRHNIDLVVMGTHGRSGLGKILMGSVAEEIFRMAPCPVLTVGPRVDSGPLWEGRLREILFATDFETESMAAARYAVALAQEFQAHLTLMHVIPERKAGDLVSPAEVQHSAANLLRKLVPREAEYWCEPHCIVEHGNAADKILEVASQRRAGLTVMGAHPERGFPGAATHLPIATAHKILVGAVCPVLTVRG